MTVCTSSPSPAPCCVQDPTRISKQTSSEKSSSFATLRLNYLVVTVAIMLADGLQGTHLYVLYDGYGFSVARLYALGFAAAAITTPLTGPLIDKFGRKRAALLYCVLEIGINMLEQYPFLTGLVVSRMVGGVTTNLLSSVFETWLDTEYRQQGLESEKYEIIMRDSVVVSNVSAIASGYLAHVLAVRLGPVGPFQGAVACTAVALAIVQALWTENFGGGFESSTSSAWPRQEEESPNQQHAQPKKRLQEFVQDAVSICRTDSRVFRVGIIQGLSMGSLQTFVFLWSPTLQAFAQNASKNVSLGLDGAREPAYGLIFGAFMAAGVIGGFFSPVLRKIVTVLFSPGQPRLELVSDRAQGRASRPMAVEMQAAVCYFLSAGFLFLPCMLPATGEQSFTVALFSFLLYELVVGVTMPCEGVIRSFYLPSKARATMMMLPRIIVNVAVACGVILTQNITTQSAFAVVSSLMLVAATLQLSLMPIQDWTCLLNSLGVGTARSGKRRFSWPSAAQINLRRSGSGSSDFLSLASVSECDLSSTSTSSGEASEEWQEDVAAAADDKTKLE